MPMNDIYPASTHLVIGRPNRGKSTLVCDLLHSLRYVYKVVVFSPTEVGNGTFGRHIPRCYIYDTFNEERLKRIVDMQQVHCKGINPKETQRERVQDFSRVGVVVVLDDVAFDKTGVQSKTFKQILCNHRNMQMALIYVVQDPVMLDRANRTQMDYVWALNETYPDMRKRMFDWYFGVYGKKRYQQYEDDFALATRNFGAYVSDSISQPDPLNPTQHIHWHRAPLERKQRSFAIGSRDYWRKAKKRGFKRKRDQSGAFEDDLSIFWGGTPSHPSSNGDRRDRGRRDRDRRDRDRRGRDRRDRDRRDRGHRRDRDRRDRDCDDGIRARKRGRD